VYDNAIKGMCYIIYIYANKIRYWLVLR
jgi:hypothetical protein